MGHRSRWDGGTIREPGRKIEEDRNRSKRSKIDINIEVMQRPARGLRARCSCSREESSWCAVQRKIEQDRSLAGAKALTDKVSAGVSAACPWRSALGAPFSTSS